MSSTQGGVLGAELEVLKQRFAILVSRWYEPLTSRLLEGAKNSLKNAGCSPNQIDVYWVPGSFELSQATSSLAKSGKYSAIIPLGILIRGETSHYDHIADTVIRSLDQIGRDTGVAVSLGLVTVENRDQAIARTGGKKGNKGEEAARAALELLGLLEKNRGSN